MARLYNSQNDQLADVPDHLAKKYLKYNHVSEGGIWVLESEMKKYFDLEEISPTEASDVKPLPDLMIPKKAAVKAPKVAKPAPLPAKAKPVKKAQTQPVKGLAGLGVTELRAMAVKKLGMEEAEAKTYKKDELIEALKKK